MGEVIIKVPEEVHKEYEFESIAHIEAILQELERKMRGEEPENLHQEKWKSSLLTMSVWTEEAIGEIEKARVFINQWQPQQLF